MRSKNESENEIKKTFYLKLGLAILSPKTLVKRRTTNGYPRQFRNGVVLRNRRKQKSVFIY